MDQQANEPSASQKPSDPVAPPVITAQIIADSRVTQEMLPANSVVRPRRIWSPFVVIFASLMTFMLASFVMLLVGVIVVHGRLPIERLQDPEMLLEVTRSRIGFPLVVVVPQLALIIPCVAAAILSPVPTCRRLGLVRGNWPLWAWVAAMVATPLVGMSSGLIASQFVEESEHLKQLGGMFRQLATGWYVIPVALMIGVTPAICEELLFRGYVQTRLTESFGAISSIRGNPPIWSFVGSCLGVLIASIFFALFHWDFVHIVTVFPIGLFLGWVTFRSGSLVPAMLGHFLNNALSVVIMVSAPEDAAGTLDLPAAIFSLSMLGLGSVGMLGVIIASYLYSPHRDWPNRLSQDRAGLQAVG